jgi:hypothetical protein
MPCIVIRVAQLPNKFASYAPTSYLGDVGCVAGRMALRPPLLASGGSPSPGVGAQKRCHRFAMRTVIGVALIEFTEESRTRFHALAQVL